MPPMQVSLLCLAIVFCVLGALAAYAGAGESGNLLLGMGIGTMLGANLMGFAARRGAKRD